MFNRSDVFLGERCSSVGDGGVVQLWNATTGKPVWRLHLARGAAWAI